MRNTSRRRMKGAKGLSLKFYDYSFRGSICIFHFFELTHEPPPQMIIAVRQSHQIPATMLWAIYIRTTLKCIHSGSKKKKRETEREANMCLQRPRIGTIVVNFPMSTKLTSHCQYLS